MLKAAFLPVTREGDAERGWDRVDFVYVSGRRTSIILVRHGHHHASAGGERLTRWAPSRSLIGTIRKASPCSGEPRLAFLVSPAKHGLDGEPLHGGEEASTQRRVLAGGEAGRRPEPRCRGVTATRSGARSKKTPLILGGIEASPAAAFALRLLVGQAEALHPAGFGGRPRVVRHGEHSIIEIADALNAGLAIEDLTFIDGTVYRAASLEHVITTR